MLLQAELPSTRTLAEVQELEAALTLLIYRVGGIKKARNERSIKAHRSMMDLDGDIPMEVWPFCTDGVANGFYKYYAHKEKAANERLSLCSRELAVWADAELINDRIREQLPFSTHRVRCCSRACAQLVLRQMSQSCYQASYTAVYMLPHIIIESKCTCKSYLKTCCQLCNFD